MTWHGTTTQNFPSASGSDVWTEITRPQYERKGLRYASDPTVAGWERIAPHMPPRRRGAGRAVHGRAATGLSGRMASTPTGRSAERSRSQRQLHLRVQPSSRKMLGEYPHGVVPQETCQTAGRGSGKRHHRYRWMAGLPLRGGADALHVTWLEVEVAKPDGLDRRIMKPIIAWHPFEKGR